MKTVKVKVEVKRVGGATHSVYPPECRARWLVIETDTIEEGGKKYQWRMALMPDSLADNLVSKYPNDYKIVNDEEANAFGRKYFSQETKIGDEKKILAILAKQALGKKLTIEEQDALNPDKSESGISKTNEFNIAKSRIANANNINDLK